MKTRMVNFGCEAFSGLPFSGDGQNRARLATGPAMRCCDQNFRRGFLSRSLFKAVFGRGRIFTPFALLLLLACSSCASLKQCAPNSWNGGVSISPYGKPVPYINLGVGGALPWGKQ
jgi:hypothetical protein